MSISAVGLSELLDKFRSFTAEADQIIQNKMLESVTENIVVVAKSLAPKRTGALEQSIEAVAGDDPMSVILMARKKYAGYLENGTRPHTIVATNAKALAFKINGRVVFARSVQLPGIPRGKFSFLRPAIEVGKDKVASDIANVIIEQFG
ncbi:MAG: HK97-gp10 family putative phage morphogenesis protein [Nitrososphaerales archaeon]